MAMAMRKSDHPWTETLPDLNFADHGFFETIAQIPDPFRIGGGNRFHPVSINQPQTSGIEGGNLDKIFRIKGLQPIITRRSGFWSGR